ncbi:MAG: hypothetical protein GC164_13040 [Phycisphaera sp.]|nr:hypothetical protein [Phycisphaera sp.]
MNADKTQMMKARHPFRQSGVIILVLLVGMALSVVGCVGQGKAPVDVSVESQRFIEGYSLLHGVLSDEAGVGGLTLIKKYDPATEKLLKDIAAAAGGAKKYLEVNRDKLGEVGVRFDRPGLPEVEVRSRDWIAGRSRNAILFGGQSELHAILSQRDATQYLASLADTLADLEPAGPHRDWLEQQAKVFLSFYDRALSLLAARAAGEGQSGD